MYDAIVLREPLTIGTRLLPCLDFGGGSAIHLSPEPVLAASEPHRQRWTYVIEAGGETLHVDDALETVRGTDASAMVREAFASLVDFLLVAVESYRANGLEMQKDTNTDLFPEDVIVWANAHEDELGNAAWLLSDASTDTEVVE